MDIKLIIAFYAVFLFTITIHEYAHAWMSKRLGDSTAYDEGLLSMHPLLHIKKEPFGMLILPLISLLAFGWPFGYSSVPADLYWILNNPKKASLVAFAGPGINLVVIILVVLLSHLGILAGFFSVPEKINFTNMVDANYSGICSSCALILSIVFTVNLVSFVLNLIPLPPLDGSKAVAFFFKKESAEKYLQNIMNPMFGFIGLFLAWKVFDPLFDLVFMAIINVMYPGTTYS